MKRSLVSTFAMGSAAAALALGTVACGDTGGGADLEPGMEEGGGLEEGGGGLEEGGETGEGDL